MYKLNKNSNASKFYSWIWNTDVSKFKTMCPYFWRYVLTILFLPVILFCKYFFLLIEKVFNYIFGTKPIKKPKAVQYIGNKIDDVTENPKVRYYANRVGNIAGITTLILIGLGALTLILYSAIMYPLEFLAAIGATTLLVGAVIGVVHLAASYNIGKPFVVTGKAIAFPFRVTGNMIGAVYKNLCPIIKWES